MQERMDGCSQMAEVLQMMDAKAVAVAAEPAAMDAAYEMAEGTSAALAMYSDMYTEVVPECMEN
jgi:hypothetical protein